MSIRVRWQNDDHRLLVVQFTAHWTWNEFFRAKAVLDNMLDCAEKPANCMFLLPTDVLLPPDSIRNGKHAYATIHPNLNHIVIAKPNVLIQTVYQMIIRQYPDVKEWVTLIDSQAQALQFLDALTSS